MNEAQQSPCDGHRSVCWHVECMRLNMHIWVKKKTCQGNKTVDEDIT